MMLCAGCVCGGGWDNGLPASARSRVAALSESAGCSLARSELFSRAPRGFAYEQSAYAKAADKVPRATSAATETLKRKSEACRTIGCRPENCRKNRYFLNCDYYDVQSRQMSLIQVNTLSGLGDKCLARCWLGPRRPDRLRPAHSNSALHLPRDARNARNAASAQMTAPARHRDNRSRREPESDCSRDRGATWGKYAPRWRACYRAVSSETSSISFGSSTLPVRLTRFDTGHSRRRSSGADRNNSVPASPLSHGPKSFGSMSTGMRSWMARVSELAAVTIIVHERTGASVSISVH